jgi:hypothetical protein
LQTDFLKPYQTWLLTLKDQANKEFGRGGAKGRVRGNGQDNFDADV